MKQSKLDDILNSDETDSWRRHCRVWSTLADKRR